jgi:hypothetical protein
MHCLTVVERDYPEDPIFELWYPSLEADAPVRLPLPSERVSQNPFTPLRADVGALLKHNGLEVPCRLEHVSFALSILAFDP